MAEQGRPGRGNSSPGDVVRSVFVLGAIMLVLFGIGQLITYTPEHPVREVDYVTAAEGARTQTGFEPLVPAALAKDWRPTSARFDATTWNLGIVTPDEEFVGLIQSTDSVESVIDDFAPDAKESGELVIDGTTWRRFLGPGEDVTVAHVEGDQSIVVTSSLDQKRLTTYVQGLTPLDQSGLTAD